MSAPRTAPRAASRRERQALALYQGAAQITDFPELTRCLDRYGPNTTPAMMSGARAAIRPFADSTERPAILWPIQHPDDILKPQKRELIGVYWSDPRTQILQGKKGKSFINRRAGGLLFGSTEGAHTLYVTDDPCRGLAVHGVAGQPALVLFTPGGLKGISEATIHRIAAAGLSVSILVEHKHADAAAVCASQIKLSSPQVAVTVSPFTTWGDDWLDALAEAAFLKSEAAPPEPRKRCDRGEFLAQPDLTGGPMGPEPPPIDSLDCRQPRNVIPIIPWRPRAVLESEQVPVFPDKDAALETAMNFLREAVRGAYVPLAERQAAAEADEPVRKPIPYLIRAAAGFGKTTLLTALLREAGLPVFWLSPTKVHAEEIALALAARLWDGRNDVNCLRFYAVESLTEKGRSPHANACRTCPHGNKESGAVRCDFIKNLADAIQDLMIAAQHGAGGYGSTLLQYEDEQQGSDELRLQVIDEKVPTEARTEITLADIQFAYAAAVRAATFWKDVAGRREEVKKVSVAHGSGPHLLAARDDEIAAAQETRDWCQGMVAGLTDLAAFMGELRAAPEGQIALTDVDKTRFKDFIKLAGRPPKACLSTDATILEKVEQIWGKAPVIPLRWIQPLGKAIKAGTAWKIGDKILASNVSGLWKRLLKKGGILLDATSTRGAEIEAAGGKVLDIQIATPNLKTVLYAGRLWGRGGLPRVGQTSTKRLEEMVAQIKAILARYPDAVVVTHRPVAIAMNDERVRHWGTHRAHNDWRKKKHLILFGLPLLSPTEQIIQYAVYRAVMARHGIDLAPWNGERCQTWVPMGPWEILPAAQLPAVKDARDWLLGELNAEVAQAVGRLRAVQRPNENLLVEIYGFLPISGHGLKVDEIRLEATGRLHDKTRIRSALAAGVVDLGEARTRTKLVDYVKRHTGVRISNGDADALLREIKIQALTSGVTLEKAARESCAITTRLLEAGHAMHQAIAAAARDIGGLPGVVAVASLLDQCRRAPGAQRAGP